MALLEVADLTVRFYTEEGVVTAVDGLSYRIEAGEKFGVVGESGAGKSVASLSLMRLVDEPGYVERGTIRFREPTAVDRCERRFPDAVVDLDQLRDEYDLAGLAERLDDRDVSGRELTGQKRHGDEAPTDLVRAGVVDLRDLAESEYAVELGLLDREDFVFHDGDERYVDLLRAPTEALRRIRGNNVAMIFQDAETALNPAYTVGEQIAEAVRHHLGLGEAAARERAVEMLETVGIPDPGERYADYPHEFSGGMAQRVVIAIALSCDPDLLICDEPTTALDVTIEAQIMELIEELASEFDTAIQLITHDLGVIADVCDRVMVVYAGQAAEVAPVEDLYYRPSHPYTAGLMASIPRIGDGREDLETIPGRMPDLIEVPPGCTFHPRCPYAEGVCTEIDPALVEVETGEPTDPSRHDRQAAACHAHTGLLDGELDYEVVVEEGPGEHAGGESPEPPDGGTADGGDPAGGASAPDPEGNPDGGGPDE